MRRNSKRNNWTRGQYFRIGGICLGIAILLFHFEGLAQLWKRFLDASQPILFGLGFSILLNPVYKKLKTRSKKLAIVGCVGVIAGLVAIIVAAIVPALLISINGLKDRIPEVSAFVGRIPALEALLEKIIAYYQNKAQLYLREITNGFVSILQLVMDLGIGIVVMVYILSMQEDLKRQFKMILELVLAPKKVERFLEQVSEAGDIFSAYVSGTLLDSGIMTLLTYIGCRLLGVPEAMLVAVVMGVTNIIPFFGPIIGATISVCFVFLLRPWSAVTLGVFLAILQQLDGNFLAPKILGDSTGLRPFWVLFATIIGGGMFGFFGMLLGVPVFAVFYKILADYVKEKRRFF